MRETEKKVDVRGKNRFFVSKSGNRKENSLQCVLKLSGTLMHQEKFHKCFYLYWICVNVCKSPPKGSRTMYVNM